MIPQNSTSQNSQHRAKIMSTMYSGTIEDLPPDCLVPLGKSVQINAFVDTDLVGELTKRYSQTGILIFLNISPTV